MNRISVNVLFALVFLSLLSPFIYTVEAAVVCTGTTKCTHLKLHNGSGLCDDTETAWCVCAAGHANHVTTGECVEGAACTGGAGSCAGTGHTGTCAANGTDCICKLGYTDGGAAAGTCAVDVCTTFVPAAACSTNGDGTCTANMGCNCDLGYANVADGTCEDICTAAPPVCSSTNDDGTCTANTGCKCNPGYANIADGRCVDICTV
eukprot:Lankesteria_metandrocarpae@DN5434_c0_g1_i10.p1